MYAAINLSQPQPYYTYFAQNTPGEYAFIVKVNAGVTLPQDPQTGTFDLTLFDLHYQGTGQFQRVYKYTLDTNNSTGYTTKPGQNPNSCIAPVSSQTVYADTPFGEYVREFFTTLALDTVYIPPVGDKYYVSSLVSRTLPNGTSQTARDWIYYGAAVNGVGQTKNNPTRTPIKLTSAGQKDEFPAQTNAKRQLNANSNCNNGSANNRNTNLLV